MGAAGESALDREFDHDRVEFVNDRETGMRGVIAIHSRALGPAMGGLRLAAYSDLTEATVDALRLSRAMTWKNSAADLDLGGGKAVLIDDGRWGDERLRERRMRALGRRIERLGGEYVTAEDVGTTPEDMIAIGSETRWVAGRPESEGGRGDPSAATARTVFAAIRAGAEVRFGTDDLRGLRVGVLGCGHVGSRLARMLAAAGANLVVADVVPGRAAEVATEVGGAIADPNTLVLASLDVLSPCALGGAIEPGHAERLQARVIAGAANNQLSDSAIASALSTTGVLYVPDFLANCGGIIHVGAEVLDLEGSEVEERLVAAELRIRDVLLRADREGRVPWELAMEIALERVTRAECEGAAELKVAL